MWPTYISRLVYFSLLVTCTKKYIWIKNPRERVLVEHVEFFPLFHLQ